VYSLEGDAPEDVLEGDIPGTLKSRLVKPIKGKTQEKKKEGTLRYDHRSLPFLFFLILHFVAS